MRKPKVIPEGFEWDSKAKELVDTRCNNAKLRKMMKNAVRVDKPAICISPICISPFYSGKDTKKDLKKWFHSKDAEKNLGWGRYMHIPILTTNAKLQRMLLGLRLHWTIKEDGENVTIWLRKKKYSKKSQTRNMGIKLPRGFELVVSSHNQENASQDIVGRVRETEDYLKILKFIEANPTLRVVAEECTKGASVTGIRRYPRNILYVVDIFDTATNNFLSYTQVYQYCYHYGIPVVTLYATTRHRTIRDLNHFADFVLEYCNTDKDYGKDEGVVIKAFREKHRCKDCGKEW